jgi:hypothetical protein
MPTRIAYLVHSVAGVLLVSPSAAVALFVAPTDQPVPASRFALAHTDVLLILLGCPVACSAKPDAARKIGR